MLEVLRVLSLAKVGRGLLEHYLNFSLIYVYILILYISLFFFIDVALTVLYHFWQNHLEGVVREEFQMGLAQKAAKRSAAVPLQIPPDVLFSRAGFGTRFLPGRCS